MRRVFANLLKGVLLAGILWLPPLWASGLPPAADLEQDGLRVQQERMPILIFFAAEDCAYCELVNGLYLDPMYHSGRYEGKVLFRVVQIDEITDLKDFDGQRTDHESFAEREGVDFTPVIRLYDHRGRELAPELFGYSAPDFYLGYLEQAIETARARLRDVARR